MINKTQVIVLSLLFNVLFSISILAQNNFGSEKELKKQADGLFKDDDYAPALPLYSQLLSLYPKDANYNYRYGVCLLYAKENKEKPLPYLTFALGKDGVDDDIYYHLGKAYQLNYRFDDAINQYVVFKQKKAKTSTKLEVDLQIQQCNNGKTLLRNITDLTVLERKELNTSEYFRAYNLDKISAKLVVKPEELKTSFDIKKKDQSAVVLRQTSQEVYYSSYGADGKSGRDIYKAAKLPNFTFGKPENLGPNINTQYDEDYPYITADGKTLYFSSKGHNSMGGYDIFKSEMQASGEWSKPTNLDFAINTPDDDIQYITDKESDFAYFSSKRNSAEGRIMVFKIKNERVPITAAIIKGTLISDETPPNKVAKISIKNTQTGKFVGTYTSAEKDGKYRLNLNNGVKYEYTVEQTGTPPITQMVEIPAMNELRPLKQEIQIKKKDGATTMIIYNFFSDTVENNALATAELFKERANLDVNYDEQIQAGIISEASASSNTPAIDNKQLSNRNAYQGVEQSVNSTEKKQETPERINENVVEPKKENDTGGEPVVAANKSKKNKGNADNNETNIEPGIGNTELVSIAKEDAIDTQKDADEMRDKSRQAYSFASIKNNSAQQKYNEATEAENNAQKATDIAKKQEQQDLSSKSKKEGDLLSQQAIVAYNLAKDLELEANNKQTEAFTADQYAKDLESAVESNSTEALAKLEQQGAELEKNSSSKTTTADNLSKQSQDKLAEATILRDRKDELKAELQESLFDEKIEREAILKAKKEAEKAQHEDKLKDVLEIRVEKQKELDGIDDRVEKLKNEAENLEEEARINKDIMAEIASTAVNDAPELSAAEKQKLDAQLAANSTTNNTPAIAQKKQESNPVAVVPNANVKSAEVVKNTESKPTPTAKTSALASNNAAQLSIEDESKYLNSFDEKLKENLLAQAVVANQSADSIKTLLRDETDESTIQDLTKKELDFKNVASSKIVAANLIAFNIYNKEYTKNQQALNKQFTALPEGDQANFKNSITQIENDYQKAITSKTNAVEATEWKVKEEDLIAATNSQNIVLVRQRILLEEANSSIANNNASNKATAEFKGFDTNKRTPATEAVNNLRPNYSNFETSLTLTAEEAAKIKATAEYLQFEGIVNKAKEYENSADAKAIQQLELRKQGEEKVIESQQLIDLAAEEKKKSKRNALAEEAVRIDNEGREFLDQAEAMKVDAQNDMLKAAAIKSEADKYLNTHSKEEQQKYIAAITNKVQTGAEAVVAINNEENSVASTQVKEQNKAVSNTAKEQTPPAKVEPTISNSTPVIAEAKKESTANQPLETAKNAATQNAEPLASGLIEPEQKIITKPVDKEAILASIKATPEYKEYADLKDAAEAIKESASLKRAEADTMKMQAQREAMNSNDQFEFAAAQPKKKDRKAAQLKAEEMDREAKEWDAKAIQLSDEAATVEASSKVKQNEADNYLKKLDQKKAQSVMMAYNNIVPDEVLQTAQKETPVIAQTNSAKTQNATTPKPVNEPTIAATNNQANASKSVPPSINEAIENTANNNNAAFISNVENKQNVAINNTSAQINAPQNTTQNPVVTKRTDVKTSSEYTKFVGLKNESELANKEAQVLKVQVDSLKLASQEKMDESNSMLDQASSLKKRKRKPYVVQAAQMDYESQLLARQADSLSTFANEATKKANDKKAESDKYIASLDKNLALRIMRAIEGISEPEETNSVIAETSSTEVINNKSVVANVQNKNTIGIQAAKPHSSGNPIPMNQALPDGIIFKVQIGAFNRPVEENAFGNVSPIMGETIANSNLIRYTAGLFAGFDDAVNARKELNGLKFNDAFIVAYCYGKRMSVTEARNLIAAGKDCKSGNDVPALAQNNNKTSNTNTTNTTVANSTNTTNTPQNNSAVNNVVGNNTAVNNTNTSATTPANNNLSIVNANLNAPATIKAGETLPQQSIQQIKGLLYTVQVGVYSKAVKAGQLYNITPLYFEMNQKNQFRYTSGIFNDINEAKKAKDLIVQIGVNDAFVSAYLNGQRIPVEQAASMEAQQGKSVFAQMQGMNVLPKTIPQSNEIGQRSEIKPEPVAPVVKTPVAKPANIVYKVQLGAFRNEVPVEIMNTYLTIADKGIANFKAADLTIYTVGNYSDFNTANNVKAEVIAKGISDAFVIALNNGEKISIEEAKQLNGK